MKTLQNNFTTPEQSKQLLELGVPADSADCYYTQEEIEGNMYWFDLHVKREYQPHTSLHASITWGDTLPCWSVGRLIEIFELCTSSKFERIKTRYSVLTDVLWQIEMYVTEASKGFSIDFSKLKEDEKGNNN